MSWMTVLYCRSALFLWNILVTPNESRTLQIKEVEICPTDQSQWEKASRDLNCTNPDRYQCTPNENLTALLEYCYHQPPTFVEKGFCWIISDSHFTDTYKCSGFTEGCPNTTYRSNELYKYQECLKLNKLEGCYLADQNCPTPGNVTRTSYTPTMTEDDTFSSEIFLGTMVSGAFIIIVMIIFAALIVRRRLIGMD
ncbi:uncharacterized protein LOC134279151 [Saccostrea cucullata]|uniref:uncharacterized protein LOC134279151 n=1 Tax=Saccostrea cuccullata TaxID=36930 RepID=UPI002ED3CC35